MTERLRMTGVVKSFYGVTVLHGVDLACAAGEVHAIVGENGAGKSTLMKVLAGVHRPDAGTVAIDGEPVELHHPLDAQHHGVAIIYQEFNLLPDRTVAQNVFLGREPVRRGMVDARRMERDADALLERLGAGGTIRAGQTVRELSIAEQQTVEIAKALSLDARILVMDEPTAALSPAEAEGLLERVAALKAEGIAVLYISHRLREVFAIADRITVLKDGAKVAEVAPSEVTSGELVGMMVGRELDDWFPPRGEPGDLGDVRLAVRGGANAKLADVDLEVRAGEIVGLAGLQGSGRTELARALFGVEPFTAGQVEVGGRPVRIRSPRHAIRERMGFITEDRKVEGLVPVASVTDNTLLGWRALSAKVRRRRGIEEAVKVSELLDSLELHAASLDQEVRYLSGGNQQKVVLGKWLATQPDVLIFDEPTRGIDVGAKAGIHQLMRDLARGGKAVLMISSELPEVLGMSDRVVVLRGGRIAGELPAGASEEEVIRMATGEAVAAA